jgi:hypothetical protein
MIKLSNRGQSLALFVVFIPFFIMIGVFVVDASFAKYNANRLNEITKMVTRYGINHVDEDPYYEMVDLIYKNDDDIDSYDIKIDAENKMVSVTLDKATEGFFGKIINKEIYKERSSYVGTIKDEKIVIEKESK